MHTTQDRQAALLAWLASLDLHLDDRSNGQVRSPSAKPARLEDVRRPLYLADLLCEL